MKRTPRHTLLRTAAVLTLLLPALTACTIVSRTVPAADEPITFASFLPDVTKAVVNNEEDMEDFAVWMYIDGVPSLEQERVYNADAASSSPLWTYDSKRFWTEGNYNFYALHPFPGSIVPEDGTLTASCSPDEGISIISFSAESGYIDLMTAGADRSYPDEGSDAVAFAFNHLLSKVSIHARSYVDNISLSSAAIEDVMKQGTYTESGQWTLGTDVKDYSVQHVSPVTLVKNSDPVPIAENFLLIPQSGDLKLSFSYNDGNSDLQKSIDLPGTVWEPGRSYVYVITFRTDVVVDVNFKVVPWDDRVVEVPDFN